MNIQDIASAVENFDQVEQNRWHDIQDDINDPLRVKGCALHIGMTRAERVANGWPVEDEKGK